MPVVNAWEGVPSSTEIPVVVKIDGSAARLALWDNEELSGTATFYDPDVGPTAEDICRFVAGDLEPATEYWWQVEVDTVLDTSITGYAQTLPTPGTPFSFTIAAASCAGGTPETPGVGDVLAPNHLSNHAVFDTIRQAAPLFFTNLGDFTYYDPGRDPGHENIPAGAAGATVEIYRRMFDDLLLQPRQHQLYQRVPLWLGDDDHDRGFNNNDETFPWHANYLQVHRERVPFLPGDFPSATANYRARHVGRVLFAMADVRSARSPNTDPDGPGKTMLGSEQKTWLRGLLESSDAEFFVWFSPSRWIGNDFLDSWDVFDHERNELVGMFADTGWIDRMCIVAGDMHDLAIDTGTNSAGGTPLFQFASMDSASGDPKPGFDTGPTQPGRNQYGTIEIVDDGQQIQITGSGMIGSSLWNSHTFTVGQSEPEPEPGEPGGGGLPQVARAQLKAVMSWLACDLSSGKVLGSLPNLQVSEVSRVIGDYTSSSVQLPIPAVGGRDLKPSERAALARARTEAGRTMIVAVVNNIPLWAGIPLSDSWGTPATTPLGYASVDAYLRHRYVRDHDWDLQDTGSVIAAQLLADANAPIDGHGGGIGLVIDAQPTGRLESRKYRFYEHRSVYDALTKLMAAGGLEWTIDIDWAPGQVGQFISLIARVRPRLGVAAMSGALAVFTANVFSSTGAASASYALDGDYSDGHFANVVYAYSSGQGEKQPVSDPAIDAVALDAGAPIWEKHFQPEQSISSIALLDAHAAAELDRVRRGHSALNVEAVWNAYPRYGIDWQLGDDVGVKLYGHAHPDGLTGVRRAVGFRLQPSAGTITPILQEDVV